MAQETLFYYFGDDEAYFKTLQGEFHKHTKIEFKFERHYSGKESEIQAFFLLIIQHKPKVIFLDFSKNSQDYLHLARLCARTNFAENERPITVGLLDYLSPREVMFESIATGIHLTHIKSAEVFDVVYDVAIQISPDAIPAHGFATADLDETWEAGAVTKIGYIHKTGVHLETDYKLAKGDRVILDHYWTKDKLVPSKEMFVTNVTNKNLFYHFKSAADLEFVMIDEFIPPEGMEPEVVEEKKAEREDLVRRHKKKFAAWVEDNLDRSVEKHTKFLIIDKDFRFYQGQKRTDKYPYIIRCVPILNDIADDLNRLCPQLISVALESTEVKDAKLDYDFLEKLVNVVKRDHAETAPYIVVFNTKVTTKELRRQLQYDNMMATDGELEAELLIKMAELLDKKIADQKRFAARNERIYIKKTNEASHALIMQSLKVLKLSESDMTFTCDREIPAGLNLYFTRPVPFYLNVRPVAGKGKTPEYTGLIHCIGETDKKELRRYVNSIFFRDHDAQTLAELEEFKNLNADKLKEKLEAIRIAQEKALAEEEAKKAAEEEAKKKADEEKAALAAHDFSKPKA